MGGMMLHVPHPWSDGVLLQSDRGSDGVREGVDARQIAHAVANRPFGTIPQREQRLAPEVSVRSARDGEDVDISRTDSADTQALRDRARRESRNVLDAAQSLFLDRSYQPAVADQGGGDVAVIGVQAEDVHGTEAASVASGRRPMTLTSRV